MKFDRPKPVTVLRFVARVTIAVILLQTLFFKFTSAPGSVYVFTRVGLEPWGRYGIGVIELGASLLLFSKKFSWLGSFLSGTVMIGAIFSHLTLLGINVHNDHGTLFIMSLVVFFFSLTNLFLERSQIPWVGELLSQPLDEVRPKHEF